MSDKNNYDDLVFNGREEFRPLTQDQALTRMDNLLKDMASLYRQFYERTSGKNGRVWANVILGDNSVIPIDRHYSKFKTHTGEHMCYRRLIKIIRIFVKLDALAEFHFNDGLWIYLPRGEEHCGASFSAIGKLVQLPEGTPQTDEKALMDDGIPF